MPWDKKVRETERITHLQVFVNRSCTENTTRVYVISYFEVVFVNRSCTANTTRSKCSAMSATTMATARFRRHSQDKRDVKLLLVEDAKPSREELPKLVLVDARVVLERREGGGVSGGRWIVLEYLRMCIRSLRRWLTGVSE